MVEELSYTGPTERLVVRLDFNPQQAGPGLPADNQPRMVSADERYPEGFPVTATRTKWEANEMNLSPGDSVVVGLKDYRLLAHYPLDSETGAKVLKL